MNYKSSRPALPSPDSLIDEINRLEDDVRALQSNAANGNKVLSDEVTLLRSRVDALLHEKSNLNAALVEEKRIITSLRGDSETPAKSFSGTPSSTVGHGIST